MRSSTILGFALAVSSALASPNAESSFRRPALRKRWHTPFGGVLTDANIPTTSGGKQKYDIQEQGNWAGPLGDDFGGIEFDVGDIVGWRVHGHNDSAALVTMLSSAGPLTYSSTSFKNRSQPDVGLDLEGAVLTNYPSVLGSANASSSGNITYGPSQPVPFTTSLQIVAVDCGLTLRAYVHYANGSQTILHGKDEINLDITTVANVTILNHKYPEMRNIIRNNQSFSSPWSVKYGPGPQLPVVTAGISASFQFCPD